MLNAVIFDIDGTLVDSVDLHAECWSKAFRRFGKDIPPYVIRRHVGIGGDRLVRIFFSDEEIRHFGKALDEYRDKQYQTHYPQRVRPFPRVRDLFSALTMKGIRLALASSAKRPELDHYVKLLKIGSCLSAAVSADDADESKPAPDILEAAQRALGLPKGDATATIGDSPYDAIAARGIGLEPVGVLSGKFPPGELLTVGCIALFHDPADILERLSKFFGLFNHCNRWKAGDRQALAF